MTVASRLHPSGLLMWHLLVQMFVYNSLTVLALLGRKLQGGDRPIAVPLRFLYGAAIAAAVAWVGWMLWSDRDRLAHRALRLAARSRQRPMLALYLLFWFVLGLSFLLGVMAPGIERGLATLWTGGSRGLATSTGDNSVDITALGSFLGLSLDVAALGACIFWINVRRPDFSRGRS